MPKSKLYELTSADKRIAIKAFEQFDGDLRKCAKAVFDDPNEDGRTVKGRALRNFYADQNLQYRVKVVEKEPKYDLTSKERSYIDNNYNSQTTKKDIARELWPKESRSETFFESERFKACCRYINNNFSQTLNRHDDAIGEVYVPPTVTTTAMKKINRVEKTDLDPNRLTKQNRINVDKLIQYLHGPRFIQTINAYASKQDRDLFESEFIKATWNKPDLTSDEINLYINLCVEYLNMKEILERKQRLNVLFREAQDSEEGLTEGLTSKILDYIKIVNSDQNECSKRIDGMISKLNGERQKRIQSKYSNNTSIISLVEAWQEEQERKNMIDMAEKEKLLIQEEAERLESMDEFCARILGISKSDAI